MSFYGTALLGNVVQFGVSDVGDEVRALVVPEVELDAYDVGPSTKRVVYGDEPADPSVSYFERDVWSENPTEPPDRIDADGPLLQTPESTYTHEDGLVAAAAIVETHGLEAGNEVAVRGSITDPDVSVSGLVGPVLAGGAVVLGPDSNGDLASVAGLPVEPVGEVFELQRTTVVGCVGFTDSNDDPLAVVVTIPAARH